MPTKVMYLEFEEDGALEFTFFLAQKLSMTVSQLQLKMSQKEFMQWSMYYQRDAQRKELASKKASS